MRWFASDFIRRFRIRRLIPDSKLWKPCREHVSKYGKDSSELKGNTPKEDVDPGFVLDNMNEVIDSMFEKYMISPMK